MSVLATVRVCLGDDFMVINQADFDPEVHELYDAPELHELYDAPEAGTEDGPEDLGGGWWRVRGEKVQGREAAMALWAGEEE